MGEGLRRVYSNWGKSFCSDEIIAIIHWNSSEDPIKLESPLQKSPLEKGKHVPWRALVITENGTYGSPFSPKTLEKRIQNAKFFP